MPMLHTGYDHPGPPLDAILGQWTVYTHTRIQPAVLHCSLATWRILDQPAVCLVWTLHGAFYEP